MRTAPAIAGVLVGACALLSACDQSGPGPDHSGAVAVSPSTLAIPSVAGVPKPRGGRHQYSDQNPRPQRAGDFVVAQRLLTTVVRDAGGHELHPDRPGFRFWVEELRTCVSRSSTERRAVGWDDWSAVAVDGRVYPASAGGLDSLPEPTYPIRKVLAPGRCATGQLLIPVPDAPSEPHRARPSAQGTLPASIRFSPDGGPPLMTWSTGL